MIALVIIDWLRHHTAYNEKYMFNSLVYLSPPPILVKQN